MSTTEINSMAKKMQKTKNPPVFLLFLPLFLLVAAISTVVAYLLGLQIIPSAIIGLGLGLCAVAFLYRATDRILISRIKAMSVKESLHYRLINQVDSLCLSFGFDHPTLMVSSSPQLDIWAVGKNPKKSCIIVTQGLIQRLKVTELEAVLAHKLSRIKHGYTKFETLALVFLELPFSKPGSRLANAFLNSYSNILSDMESARLTRYPPGLVHALAEISVSRPDSEIKQGKYLDRLSIAQNMDDRIALLEEL